MKVESIRHQLTEREHLTEMRGKIEVVRLRMEREAFFVDVLKRIHRLPPYHLRLVVDNTLKA